MGRLDRILQELMENRPPTMDKASLEGMVKKAVCHTGNALLARILCNESNINRLKGCVYQIAAGTTPSPTSWATPGKSDPVTESGLQNLTEDITALANIEPDNSGS